MGSDIWGLMANATMNTAIARTTAQASSGVPITDAGKSTATNSSTSSSTHSIGGLDPQAFMKLLLAQMQNQDPMSPVDSQAFFDQLAQLSLLEQMWQMNDSLQSMTQQQQLMQGSAMIGKTVEWTDDNGDTQTGVVSGVQVQNRVVSLDVGENKLILDQITAVHDS